MKKMLVRVLVISALSGFVASVRAADYTWRGIATQDLYNYLSGIGSPPFNLAPYQYAANEQASDGYYQWKSGAIGGVPGSGDRAVFTWDTAQTSVWGYTGNFVILNGAFAPTSITINFGGTSRPNTGTLTQVQVQKNLTIANLTLSGGQSSGGIGVDVLRVVTGNTLELTGANPIAFGGTQGNWCSLLVDSGATLRFSGASQTFNSFNYDQYNITSYPALRGGGTVEFTNPGATITLADQGLNSRAHLELGSQLLRIDPAATWQSNANNTGLIRITAANDRAPFVSTGGGRLDNLSKVAFEINHSVVTSANISFTGGTYQGFNFTGSGSSNRQETHLLRDAVHLVGGYVNRGDRVSVATAENATFSLRIGSGNATGTILNLNGFTLTTDRGILLTKDLSNTHDLARNMINASNSILNIGGTLRYNDTNANPASFRRVGIYGNANTVINLDGDFITNTKPLANANLYQANLNVIGGTSGAPRSYEIGADASQTVATQTYAIGLMGIGTASQAAYVRLTNVYLNDGSSGDKNNEVLLAGTLSIRPNSTLDLNGLKGKVVTALAIDSTGWLDLNTGLTLSIGQRVETFWGVGDQAATWAGFQTRVKDASNPGFAFQPTLFEGNTYWMAIPEPGVAGLLAIGAVLMGIRRRRV